MLIAEVVDNAAIAEFVAAVTAASAFGKCRKASYANPPMTRQRPMSALVEVRVTMRKATKAIKEYLRILKASSRRRVGGAEAVCPSG